MPIYKPQDASEACSCGRLATRVHCPQCGVYSVYARSAKLNDIVTRENGEKVSLQTYRCRVCGVIFNSDKWQLDCRAPIPAQSEKAIKKAEKDSIKPEDVLGVTPSMLDALIKIKSERGIE